jgi:microcystin-dependent protein
MSTPFLGQISIFAFNFAPRGWALCNGQLLAIAQNTALFSILGTTYGGNGTTTFALPNLQSRVPIGVGQGPGLSNRDLGEVGGQEAVTLTSDQNAPHNHQLLCSSADGNSYDPAGNYWSQDAGGNPEYGPASDGIAGSMSPAATSLAGGNQPHNNIQPYLTLNFCIAMEGIFPSRN